MVGLEETIQLKAVSRSWFARSASPFDCGWYPEVRLTVAPREA